MKTIDLFQTIIACAALALTSPSVVCADNSRDVPNVSASWRTAFPSGEVWLKITNQGDKPIRISPHLHIMASRAGRPNTFKQWRFDDNTLVDASVLFILSPGKNALLMQRGPITPPILIARGETKSFKLDVAAGIIDVAHASDEAILRLSLGEVVISTTDLKSFQK